LALASALGRDGLEPVDTTKVLTGQQLAPRDLLV